MFSRQRLHLSIYSGLLKELSGTLLYSANSFLVHQTVGDRLLVVFCPLDVQTAPYDLYAAESDEKLARNT